MDREKKEFNFFKSLKGKVGVFLQLVIIALLVVSLVQSNAVKAQLDKYLSTAEETVHEIYDDSKVLEAYRSGDDSKLDEKDKFVLDTAKSVIDEVITDDMTPYEKEKAIYDWQVAWVNYSDESLNPMGGGSEYNHLPYGVFKYHEAICVGNATTFKLFMDMLDIPCKIIHSTSEGEHAWDIVQLDDEWYHVDVTFDGTSTQTPNYTYFNVPDSIKDDGSWPYDHDEIPAATGTKYCYLLQNAVSCDDLYDIPQALKEARDEGKGLFAFTLEDKTGFDSDIADYIASYMAPANGFMYYDSSYALDGKTVYTYQIYNYGTEVEDDSEDKVEIYDKLDEIFESLGEGAVG